MPNHTAARQRVIEESKGWLGTPYHSQARVKGVGCDCLTIIVQVYENAGVIEHYDIPYYNPSFHLHHSEEVYLNGILALCDEIEQAQALPADVVLFKFGRVFSHGGIIIDWPHVMHAYLQRPVVVDDVYKAKWLSVVGELAVADHGKPRPMRWFRPKVWMT